MNKKLNLNEKIQRRLVIAGGIVLGVVLIIAVMRVNAYFTLRDTTEQLAIPTVATITVSKSPAHEKIILPGTVRAWHESTIYARTNGYIKKWWVDIGYPVKAGQLLAEIASPEVDAQLKQTEANIKTAEANYQIAQITAKRWLHLLKTDSVSKQETDEKVSAAKAAHATLMATRANRDRLRDLVSFERVIAPFNGIITSRTTDIGSLINAGTNTLTPLFHIVQDDPLRIYVRVPQNYAARIQPNMTVTLHFSQHPGKEYPAKLMQTAKAIDAATRTLLTQFIANNKNHEILPGGYTQVYFSLPIPTNIVRLPVTTLMFQSPGLQVATVGHDKKVILKNITISRDFGTFVEVNSGVKPGDVIIVNPPDSIFNGQLVRIAPSKQAIPQNEQTI